MTPEKILSVVDMYRGRLENEGILKQRMDPRLSFGSLQNRQLLAHAHYLLDGIEENLLDPDKQGKINRHLGSVQTLLSVAGWYTLQEVMEHNMP